MHIIKKSRLHELRPTKQTPRGHSSPSSIFSQAHGLDPAPFFVHELEVDVLSLRIALAHNRDYHGRSRPSEIVSKPNMDGTAW
jgi:hypothetical protein